MPSMPVACAALSFAIATDPAGGMQLLPAGEFRSRDGRPANLPGWKFDAASARRLIERAAARRTPLVIDYEHQTLNAERNGLPAPAAGWFAGKNLEWREGQGLFATDVAWTEKARAHIAADEYKFVSPVFSYDTETGEVQELQLAAITNNPGIDGMSAVAALATQFFTPPPEDRPMKALAVLLGLAEGATEEQISSAIAALKARADTQQSEIAALKTETAALKTQSPDPAKYVPVETVSKLQGELAALNTRINDGELEDVVSGALHSGKILPAMEAWARELGKKDLAALKAYVAAAVAVAPNGTQTRGQAPAGGADSPTDAGMAVMKALGLSAEVYAKGKIEEVN